MDLRTLLSRLECLRSVSTFAFAASYSSTALSIRRITAARILNDIRTGLGIGFQAESRVYMGGMQLPTIQQLDAGITLIRVALSGEKDAVWQGPLLRVPPTDLDAARQLLSALWGEIVTADLTGSLAQSS